MPAVAVAASMVAVVAAAVAVMTVAVAAEAVVVVVALAAAVSVVLSSPEPRSALSRGPKSWLRDLHLGRAQECRPQPNPRLELRIPELRDLMLDMSVVDSALLCRQAEAASES